MSTNPAPTRRVSIRWGLCVVAAALVIYPFAYSYAEDGTLASFRYFAPDAFYFLNIANRSLSAEIFTFDGSYATNGFHPMWAYYLTFSFDLLGLKGGSQLIFAGISSAVMVALGTGLFASTLTSVTRRPALSLLACVPGFFYLLTPDLGVAVGSQWLFINGVETCVSILLFGVLCHLLMGSG